MSSVILKELVSPASKCDLFSCNVAYRSLIVDQFIQKYLYL